LPVIVEIIANFPVIMLKPVTTFVVLQIQKPNLAIESTRYVETDNLWIGPRQVKLHEYYLLLIVRIYVEIVFNVNKAKYGHENE